MNFLIALWEELGVFAILIIGGVSLVAVIITFPKVAFPLFGCALLAGAILKYRRDGEFF